jgi:hypothetical protein
MKYSCLFILVIVFSCTKQDNSGKEGELLKKENELLKKELELEKKEQSLREKINTKIKAPSILKKEPKLSSTQFYEKVQIVKDLLNRVYAETKIDELGNVEIDMGSASSGRVGFNLGKVHVNYEERPEEPGCADICPPRALLKFKCLNSDCISDPAMPDFDKTGTGVIVIEDLSIARKVFEELRLLSKNLK